MRLHIGNGLAQRTVRFHQAILTLQVEPSLEVVQQRLAIRLVVHQTRRRAHVLVAGLVIMVKHLLEGIDHHPACAWKDLLDVAELATPMRQAVAANHQAFLDLIARQRVRHHEGRLLIRLALLQQRRQVLPGMRAARIVQADKTLASLDHQRGGEHPGAFLGTREALGRSLGANLLVFLDQGHNPHRGVVLVNQLPLGRQRLEKLKDHLAAVPNLLETLAAQGELIHQDDTAVRIVTLIKENQQIRAQAAAQGFSRPKERTGMFTTALVVKRGERLICLYYSGRAHAGENLAALLEKREADQKPPLVMSDALARNEVEEGLVIRCHCLAHGRRQFSDIEEVFPSACRVVIDALKQVFDHDDEARDQHMSPPARLAYHQAYSQPLMDDLKAWLDLQFEDRLVEPNSSLGQAIAYMETHWETLTRFLSVPGAPLDNNVVERALKLFIRQRKNSLFYKTDYSAYIASVLTSLIATCLYAGVNVLDYLVALQEHRAEVFADPSAWLPWTYQASLAPP